MSHFTAKMHQFNFSCGSPCRRKKAKARWFGTGMHHRAIKGGLRISSRIHPASYWGDSYRQSWNHQGIIWVVPDRRHPRLYYWVHSFSKSDKSRSIWVKRSAFSIKVWPAPTHLRKSDLAMPICAASVRILFSCKSGRGLRGSVQTRTRWPRPLRPEWSVRSFSPDWIDLHWQIEIDHLSDYEKQRSHCVWDKQGS